jgi:hypothetical protein
MKSDMPAQLTRSSRRQFIAGATAATAASLMAPRSGDALANASNAQRTPQLAHDTQSQKMNIICIIRYEIDPYQKESFREYAARWGAIIPRCGGTLIGYFLPWQGTNYVGWGLIGGFDSLASYERYQERLHRDPDAMANFKLAGERRFIVHEERTFVEVVDGTFEMPAYERGGRP